MRAPLTLIIMLITLISVLIAIGFTLITLEAEPKGVAYVLLPTTTTTTQPTTTTTQVSEPEPDLAAAICFAFENQVLSDVVVIVSSTGLNELNSLVIIGVSIADRCPEGFFQYATELSQWIDIRDDVIEAIVDARKIPEVKT